MLLYTFGLDASTGKLNYTCTNDIKCGNNIRRNTTGDIIIYDPEYNNMKNPVYYSSPNIVIPNPSRNDVILRNR